MPVAVNHKWEEGCHSKGLLAGFSLTSGWQCLNMMMDENGLWQDNFLWSNPQLFKYFTRNIILFLQRIDSSELLCLQSSSCHFHFLNKDCLSELFTKEIPFIHIKIQTVDSVCIITIATIAVWKNNPVVELKVVELLSEALTGL